MPRYTMPQQDATAVVLPQYREPVVRPYQAGDYTRPSPKAEIRRPDRPPSLGFQLMTAGEKYDRAMEKYDRAHGFFKQLFDGTGLTEAAKEANGYYENELYKTSPVAAAIGSTLTGEAFDFWRDQVTDPINVATAGMGAAPKTALGAVSIPSRYGRIVLPYRVANRSKGGVHQLEESLLAKALPSSGMKTSDVVKDWASELEPRYIDGDFRGKPAITMPPDVNVLESPEIAAHAGQMYKEQLKGLANATSLLDYLPLYRGIHRTAPVASRLGDVLQELKTNPPGPNVLQDLMHRRYKGVLLDKVEDQMSYERVMDVMNNNPDDIPRAELTRLLEELDLYNASARGSVTPWRPATTSMVTPLGVLQGVHAGDDVMYGLQAYTLAKGAAGDSPVSHLPLRGGKEHTMLYAKSPSMPMLVDPATPVSGGYQDGMWMYYSSPESYIPANAPLGGHLMSAVARDFSLPHTYRVFDDASGEYFLKHDPEAWLASLSGHPLSKRILAAQAEGIKRGVMRSEQPSVGTLALVNPEIMPYVASNLGSNFAVSSRVPPSGKLSETLLPMDKTYDSYKGAPDRVITAQRGGMAHFVIPF